MKQKLLFDNLQTPSPNLRDVSVYVVVISRMTLDFVRKDLKESCKMQSAVRRLDNITPTNVDSVPYEYYDSTQPPLASKVTLSHFQDNSHCMEMTSIASCLQANYGISSRPCSVAVSVAWLGRWTCDSRSQVRIPAMTLPGYF